MSVDQYSFNVASEISNVCLRQITYSMTIDTIVVFPRYQVLQFRKDLRYLNKPIGI